MVRPIQTHVPTVPIAVVLDILHLLHGNLTLLSSLLLTNIWCGGRSHIDICCARIEPPPVPVEDSAATSILVLAGFVLRVS